MRVGHQRAARHHQEHRECDRRSRLRRRLDPARAARDAHRQEGRGHRFRSRRTRGCRAAEQGRPLGDRARTRRSPGWTAHLRHPQHEARQARSGCAPHPAPGKGRHQVPLQCDRRRERRGRAARSGLRCDRDLHRRHLAARSARRGPQSQGRALRDGFPDGEHPGRAQGLAGFHPHHREGQRRARVRRWRHRHRLRRHFHAPGLQDPHAAGDHGDAAHGSRRGQSVARVAQGLQDGLRPGRGRGEVWRRPARVSDHREAFQR